MRAIKILRSILLISLFYATASLPQSISIINNDGSIRSSLELLTLQNAEYICINDFADIFNAHIYFDTLSFNLNFVLDKKRISFAPFSSFLQINEKAYQLPSPGKWINGKNYFPANEFLDIINKEFADALIYNEIDATLKILKPIFAKNPNIVDIDIEPKLNGTLIIVSTTKSFDPTQVALRARHQWLYLDVYGGYVDSLQLYAAFRTGKIATIIPSQVSEELAQIAFRFREEIVEKDVIFQSPQKIHITVKTKSDISDEINQAIEQEKQKWRIDKIVIDPGHGGRDPGAIGPGGTYEKNVVLAIAKYLKEFLVKKLGVEVLMTRETDRFIELKQRTAFANKHGAKLFISIHANSNPQKWLRGVSTYFLGVDMSDEARQVAQLENSVIKYENKSNYSDMTTEQFILSAGAQAMYTIESEDLAGMIQENIISECKLQNRGVRQANFYVLWGASMPNVLIETAFISNRKDEKLLRTPSFQRQIAHAIYLSIKQFKEKYEAMF